MVHRRAVETLTELLAASPSTRAIVLAFTFVLGSLVGSFLNVVVARLPAGESLAWPGSRCPKCRTPIRPHHNVPILSWLILRGRCVACRAPISARYPMVELVTGALFVAALGRFGLSAALPAAWAFSAALVAVTFVDLDIWEIPDEIVVLGLPVALLLRPLVFGVPWWSGLVGAVLGAAFLLMVRWLFFALRGVEAMGLGDVKLLAFIGAFLGPGALITTVTLASVVGSLVGGLLLLVHRPSTEAEAPGAEGASSERPEPPEAPGEEPPAAEPEPWAEPPTRMRLGAILRWRGRRRTLGLPADLAGRTHLRAGFVVGARRRPGSGGELLAGVFQDVPGWGHFEGVALGRPPRLWLGPVVGARLPDVEAAGDDAPWSPPPTAVPFGPFLSLGALATLLLAPLLGRWSALLGP